MFHWILLTEFATQALPVEIVHYLDDFLMILPPDRKLDRYSQVLANLSVDVGLTIKISKSQEGIVADFGGVELDTGEMVIHLPPKKLEKARTIATSASTATCLSLLKLHTKTAYLNFVTIVVPLGRAFFRRLYNMELYFPNTDRRYQWRVSREAQKDLNWWVKVLGIPPVRSIRGEMRDVIYLWTDASGMKGLGAYYTHGTSTARANQKPNSSIQQPQPGKAFSIPLPRHIWRKQEHINTKELRAVEQSLLHWGKRWQATRVVMHIDNRAVVYVLDNRTIQGASMSVLRRCLILAAEYDLDIEARSILTKENVLADALSRFNIAKVTNLAPQLTQPTYTPRDLGFLTYSGLVSQELQRTTSGGARPHQPGATTIPLDPSSPFSAHCQTTITIMDHVSLLK